VNLLPIPADYCMDLVLSHLYVCALKGFIAREGLRLMARRRPPRGAGRFGSPLVLSQVHWVEPKLVAKIIYLTWTADNLLRHTVYVGLGLDKPAEEVRREAGTRWDAK
jgi:ATP-dependent DNA ligase